MFRCIANRLAPVALSACALLVAGVAAAQSPAAPAPPKRDPLNAAEPVPRLVHRSAIAGHRAHADQAVGSWRDANDTVTRIGGWRTYAREANQPEAASPKPAASPATSPPAANPQTQPPAATRPAPSGSSGQGAHGGHAGHGSGGSKP